MIWCGGVEVLEVEVFDENMTENFGETRGLVNNIE